MLGMRIQHVVELQDQFAKMGEDVFPAIITKTVQILISLFVNMSIVLQMITFV